MFEKVNVKSYIAIGLVLLFFAGAAYLYFNRYMHILSDPEKIKDIITSYGRYGILAFAGLQAMQVLAFFIPGEVVQIAGGYIYGTFLGSLLSVAGITAGSILVYSVSRVFGRPLVRKIISERHLEFFDRALRLGSIHYVIFLLYLIPGIPKDVLGYVCGISDVRFRYFLLYSTLGRLPAIIVSSYFGAGLGGGNRWVLALIAVVMTALFVAGIFKGERLVKRLAGKEAEESAP
ncbi:MAG: associated protein [Firmicutes bacterium]|nr:associated protein [Bacillota bacterium]